ncbi:pilus assembly PilX N-terminal domain-containing protein [Acidithiobacillus sp.]|uniref:pilus assembly PilX family protein n=1 Tax=Acidithiobacillus sp. TaxID=1872118 RepID=UPI0025C6BB95|nr:pilus assembly PilX N-terminal domain-containing protein [Acidithiobacillus sp.]
MKPAGHKPNHVLPGPANGNENGAILVVVLIIIFALSLSVIALMSMDANNTIIASNMGVQSAALQATDEGMSQASTQLSLTTKFPEVLTASNPQALAPWYVPLPTGQLIPTTPTASYWQTCATQKTCQTLQAKYGPFNFTVEFFIQPTNLPATTLNGSQHGAATSYRYYTAFVHTQNTNGGGLGVTTEAILRKEQS